MGISSFPLLFSTGAENPARSISWSPQLGQFLVVSFSTTISEVLTSTNGYDFIPRPTNLTARQYIDCKWCDSLGLYIACS